MARTEKERRLWTNWDAPTRARGGQGNAVRRGCHGQHERERRERRVARRVEGGRRRAVPIFQAGSVELFLDENCDEDARRNGSIEIQLPVWSISWSMPLYPPRVLLLAVVAALTNSFSLPIARFQHTRRFMKRAAESDAAPSSKRAEMSMAASSSSAAKPGLRLVVSVAHGARSNGRCYRCRTTTTAAAKPHHHDPSRFIPTTLPRPRRFRWIWHLVVLSSPRSRRGCPDDHGLRWA